MSATLKALRILSDATRLRILALLADDELSVNELQGITRMGQSRISTHLGLLQETGLVCGRREGKRSFYRIAPQPKESLEDLLKLSLRAAQELPERADDTANLRLTLKRRQEREQVFFNQVAGRFDRVYGPGRSWQAFGQLLLRILPPLEVADLGAGEGLLSELLARRCQRVIAVDNSAKMVAFGARKAKKSGIKNLEFRLGDLQDPPLEPASVDLVILSQALHHAEDPAKALGATHRVLRPGGRVMILDLLKHKFVQAHELYGDQWLGFSESELNGWLEAAGFSRIEVTIVAEEDEPPHFQTLLACGEKPAAR